RQSPRIASPRYDPRVPTIRNRPRLVLCLLAALLLAVLFVTPRLGLGGLSHDDRSHILWNLRIPRIAMAALAGLSLAVAGAVFQATFGNPVADPFTLGVASGAAVGAALAFHLGWTGTRLGVPLLTLSAFAGGAISVAIVYSIAGTWRRLATETLL